MIRSLHLVAAFALLGLIGCADAFDLVRVEEAPDAGATANGTPSFCTAPEVIDSFDTTTLCPFGVTFEERALEQHDGVLDIKSEGIQPLFAGCTAFRPYPFTERGLFLHVVQPLTVDNAYMRFTARHTYETTPVMSASFLLDGGVLRFVVDGADVATRPDIPAWWRMRMLSESPTVIAEASQDGERWEEWGRALTQRPASIAVDFGAGIDALPSEPAKAVLGSFGICN